MMRVFALWIMWIMITDPSAITELIYTIFALQIGWAILKAYFESRFK